MLTRLEVDGFKNLRNIAIDFGPFTCIAGPNAAGKSNIFDAIQFLAELADRPLMEAAESVRGTRSERSADPRDLFWDLGPHGGAMKLAAEMIVPPEIEDDFGQGAKPTMTFLRYELEIGYEAPVGLERIGRLVLLRESLTHITQSNAFRHVRFPHAAKRFRRKVVLGHRSAPAYISTDLSGDHPVIKVHGDGGSRGQPRKASATRAAATIVRTTTTSDDPTILAARREMQSWRRLSLEPSALRTEDRYNDRLRVMTSDGRHLAATLYRIATQEGKGVIAPDDVYARIVSRLRQLTGVDVDRIEVDADDSRELLTLRLRERSGREIPARSLSEGTLRFLALCVMHEDASFGGVICMEEPENGIHPSNIEAMVRLVEDLAVDPNDEPGWDNPMRQVIINTHSPAIVTLVVPGDLLMASTVICEDAGIERPALRLRPMRGSWRADGNGSTPIGRADLLPYLTAPHGAQIALEA